MGLSFYEQSTGTVLLPLLVFLAVGALEVIRDMMTRKKGRVSLRSKLLTCSVLVAYLLYPSVVQAVLTVSLCHPRSVEGVQYLSADLTVPCYDGKHLLGLACSLAVLLLYALGLPVFILLKLRPNSLTVPEEYGLGLHFLVEGYSTSRYPWYALPSLCSMSTACCGWSLPHNFVSFGLGIGVWLLW